MLHVDQRYQKFLELVSIQSYNLLEKGHTVSVYS